MLSQAGWRQDDHVIEVVILAREYACRERELGQWL